MGLSPPSFGVDSQPSAMNMVVDDETSSPYRECRLSKRMRLLYGLTSRVCVSHRLTKRGTCSAVSICRARGSVNAAMQHHHIALIGGQFKQAFLYH